MTEFVSELEKIMKAVELDLAPTPGFGKYKKIMPEAAVAHPAKFNTNLVEFLIKKFTKEGDTVLDPMAGTGILGVIAALHGRNAVQVELEEKFYKWMEKAKENVEKHPTLTAKGRIVNICGDARNLSELLGRQTDAVITSPPYSESLTKKRKGYTIISQLAKTRHMGEDTGDENIANLPHGNVDAIITSPPYSDAEPFKAKEYRRFFEREVELKREGAQGGHTHSLEAQMRYVEKVKAGKPENPDNIGRLEHGNIDVIITSPPYADAKKGGEADEEKMAERWDRAFRQTGESWDSWGKTWKTEGRKRALKALGSGYSSSEDNIGNLPVGNIDAIITSPPYADISKPGNIKRPITKEEFEERRRRGDHNVYHDPRPERKGTLYEYYEMIPIEKYGSPQNIDNLPHGSIDAIITSPPYEAALEGTSRHTRGGIASRDKKLAQTGSYTILTEDTKKGVPICYSPNPQNIGNLKSSDEEYENLRRGLMTKSGKPTYLSEMLKVYREMWKVLKPGGRAIVVVKPFIRNKRVVDLPYHTYLLMKLAGFELEQLYKLRLKQVSFWRILYERKYPEVPKLRHEYVLICRKPDFSKVGA